jgi:hypothetical protein
MRPFTTLRVAEAGVVLFAAHRARLGAEAAPAFEAFAAGAAPGVYGVLAGPGGRLEVTPRAGSRLFDGIPVRRVPSPLAPGLGARPKAPPPGPYDAVRTPGLATLLTDPADAELWESCTASVLAWDGAGLVAVPADRTRVDSTAEGEVLRQLAVRRAPVPVAAGWPLLLLNAVVLSCAPAGPAFPAEVRRAVDEVLLATARRTR